MSSPSRFEYPSEQYLLDHMQPEPGDIDYNRGVNRQRRHIDSTSSDEGDSAGVAPSKPMSAPSLAVGNTSGSYLVVTGESFRGQFFLCKNEKEIFFFLYLKTVIYMPHYVDMIRELQAFGYPASGRQTG